MSAWEDRPAELLGGQRRHLSIVDRRPRVLLAGADPAVVSRMRREIADTLPDSVVREAQDVLSALEWAPASRVAVVAGDLEDAPEHAMASLLGHRYPQMSIFTLGERRSPAEFEAVATVT